jgi:hypothetical protein
MKDMKISLAQMNAGMTAMQMVKTTHSIMIEMKNAKTRAISTIVHSYTVVCLWKVTQKISVRVQQTDELHYVKYYTIMFYKINKSSSLTSRLKSSFS